eukprot:1599552-Rhodomonas_salina.4
MMIQVLLQYHTPYSDNGSRFVPAAAAGCLAVAIPSFSHLSLPLAALLQLPLVSGSGNGDVTELVGAG